MVQVLITGWKPGLRKVALTGLLQTRGGLSLRDAHDSVERCLAGETVAVGTASAAAAESLARDASELGAITSVRLSEQPR